MFKRSARRTTGAVAVLLAALFITACDSNGKGAGGDSGGESKTLELWTFLDPEAAGEPRGAALKSIVADFNAQSTNVDVKVRSINFAKIDAEVIRATASGKGPDIVNVYTAQLPSHVAAGTTLPLDKYAQPLLDKLGNDYLFPLDGVKFDDKLMALPWETRAWLLWYREDMLDKAGLKVPTTLDELSEAAAQLREDSGGKTTGLAVGMSTQGLGADFMEKFIPLTWGKGGDLLDESGKASFNTEAGAAAVEYIKKLRTDGAFGEEVLNMGADEVVNGVKAGSIAMAIEGSFRVGAARSGEGIGANLKTAPMPSDTAGKPLPTPVSGQTLAIGASTKSPDEAWQFIEYYLSPASQKKFAAAGVLPVLNSVYDDPAVAALPNAEEIKAWKNYVIEHGRPAPVSADFNRLSDLLVNAGQQIVFKEAPAGPTLDKVAETFNSSVR